MKFQIPIFKGLNNAISPRLIPDEQAQFSKNCLLRNGNLSALRANAGETTPALATSPESLFLYQDTHWFSWGGDVTALNSPIAQDQYQRVYIIGDGAPKYTNSSIATGGGALPFSDYLLGIPSPNQPIGDITYYDQELDLVSPDVATDFPVDSNSGYINITTDEDETRFYVCTLVSAYGEEGLPSVVSTVLEMLYSKDFVTLTFSDLGGFGNYNITKRRIYRTATSGEITEFFLVDEIPVTQATYVDNNVTSLLGAELNTTSYNSPPSNMAGGIITANGVLVGFAKNEIIPSEPYLPYAFPLEYRQSLPSNIVALAEMSGGIVIATDDKPAIMTGLTPNSYTLTILDAAYPCVSKRSMVDIGEAAIYASHDGLVAISQQGASLASESTLSREYWHTINPDSIHAYRYKDYYIGFCNGDMGFSFNLKDGTFTELDFYASAGFFDTKTGKLYLLVDDLLVSFDNGSELSFTWQSKEWQLPNASLSTVKVRGNVLAGITLKVIADDIQIMSKSLENTIDTFRLPAIRAERLSVELTGTGEVSTVTLGSSPQDLIDG
tara:strand:- start:159475 stop:161133 length:1659 start_codon:yes stop_codon:yes gene_type:complete